MRREILENTPLAERINRKFSIKNTCGYSLNALSTSRTRSTCCST